MGRTASRPRVLIGLREIAGYCGNLTRGFGELGIPATFANLYDDPLDYAPTPSPLPVRLARSTRTRRLGAAGVVGRALWTALDRLASVALFAWAVATHDVFIFRSAYSFFGLRELPLLRALGKRVIYVFLGTDSRPSYLNGDEVGGGSPEEVDRAVAATRAKRRVLARIERHADAIVCHTLSAHLHRRPVIAHLALGMPYPAPATAPRGRPSRAGVEGIAVRILHAPSRPTAKGSDRIRAAVTALGQRGLRLDLVEITGRPNAAVLEALGTCDFVIDQAYADTPMGAFAAEAAAFGRPAVVGGHGWDELRRTTPAEAIPPAELVAPDGLEASIERLATDAAYRRELGDRAHRFVADRWSPAAVAERYLRVISGDVPEAWWFDPAETAHAHGAGLSDERLRAGLRLLIARHGEAGLGIPDKPRLRRRLRRLVEDGGTEPAGA